VVKSTKPKITPERKRMRAEMVEIAESMHACGVMSAINLRKITMRMIDTDQLPAIEPLSAEEIRSVREQAGVSQAVFARTLNLTVSYISQLERGEKRPSGAAAKLLDVVRRKGLAAIL
jgi:putative transcriptional regulator